jgi:hypothetical protein
MPASSAHGLCRVFWADVREDSANNHAYGEIWRGLGPWRPLEPEFDVAIEEP